MELSYYPMLTETQTCLMEAVHIIGGESLETDDLSGNIQWCMCMSEPVHMLKSSTDADKGPIQGSGIRSVALTKSVMNVLPTPSGN